MAETEESCKSKCNTESYCKAWEFYYVIIDNEIVDEEKKCKHWLFGEVEGDGFVGPNEEEFKCWVNNEWKEIP